MARLLLTPLRAAHRRRAVLMARLLLTPLRGEHRRRAVLNAAYRYARLTAETTARSDAVVNDGARPTPHTLRLRREYG
jgi:hypothetical protein